MKSAVRSLGTLLPGVALAAALLVALPAGAATSEAMFDDFTGVAGSRPDGRYWDFDVHAPNAQLQTYTTSPDNVRLDGEGHLVLQALRGDDGRFTSARLVTRGKLHMTYGTLSARIKMPDGQGVSPAFWLLGIDTADVGWPDAGEIDVIEMPNTATYAYTTLHGPWSVPQPPGTASDYKVTVEGPTDDLSAGFHTYWVQRSPNLIVVGIDDRTTATFTPDSLGPEEQWVFERPMYAVLNIAVGDQAAGVPDASTTWPATMLLDWVRWEPA
jgi:beta-glucanase (GH16 family)